MHIDYCARVRALPSPTNHTTTHAHTWSDVTSTPHEFAPWLRDLAKRAGYDPDTRGGPAALAQAAGIDRGQLSRALNGKARPSIDYLRALAAVLPTTLRELLIRSGWATADELPEVGASAPSIRDVDLHSLARQFGIPPEKIELFVRVVESTAEQFAGDEKPTNVGAHTQTGGQPNVGAHTNTQTGGRPFAKGE